MPGRGQVLSCVARDPVFSQPSALPHWRCDSKAQSRAPRVVASPYGRGFPFAHLSL